MGAGWTTGLCPTQVLIPCTIWSGFGPTTNAHNEVLFGGLIWSVFNIKKRIEKEESGVKPIEKVLCCFSKHYLELLSHIFKRL